MSNNTEDDNLQDEATAIVPFTAEMDSCLLQTAFLVESIEAKAVLERKLQKKIKNDSQLGDLLKCNIQKYESDIKLEERNKENMLATLDSNKSRIIELKKQLLLTKEREQRKLENAINNVKAIEEQWIASQVRFKSIPFIKEYFEVIDKIETVNANTSSLKEETNKLRTEISVKKRELWNLDKKNIVELADYMINKRPAILKLIAEKRSKMLANTKEVDNLVLKKTLSASSKLSIEAKNTSVKDTENLSRNLAHVTLELPPLQLQNIVSFKRNQIQKIHKNTPTFKRSYATDVLKKVKFAATTDEIDNSAYFTLPKKMYQTNKYSNRKLIHIIDDVDLNKTSSFDIISKLKPYDFRDVKEIAGQSQHKELVPVDKMKKNPMMPEVESWKFLKKDIVQVPTNQTKVIAEINSQDTYDIITTSPIDPNQVKKQQSDVIEEIKLSGKDSQNNVILPPTQFLDLTQNSQENKVSLINSGMQVGDLSNLETHDAKSEEEVLNNTSNSQLTNDCDNSYEKIKDFVFKRHKLNLSPEFKYTKNTTVPMLSDEIVTSKFFDAKLEGDGNNDSTKVQPVVAIVEIIDKPDDDIMEMDSQKIKQANANTVQSQEFSHKNDAPFGGLLSSGISFRNYSQTIPDSLNISMNTTGCDDMDAEYPQCIDSSLLMSPKADDDAQTSNNKIEGLSQEVPSFMSGLKKSGFSFFGSTSSGNKPESEIQNQSDNFNFTFGGGEKTKRGGLFNMFR